MLFAVCRGSLFAVIAGLTATMAQGALIITVGDVTLMPGETKPVDVVIHSDGSDALSAFAIRLLLDTTVVDSLLQFAPPSNAELTDPMYILNGDSLASTFGSVAAISLTSTTNDTFDSGDATFSGSNVVLPMSDQLLARVDVTALPGALGGKFDLNFVAASSSFFNADGDEQSFTSTNGTVTVLGSTANVPEPFSFLLWAAELAIVATAIRLRRRA